MTRNAERPTRPGRRRFLTLSGALGLASLAGCLDRLPGSEPETIDGDAISDAVAGDTPAVSEALPVDIEASFVAEQRDVAEETLGSVPAPFDEEEIPNGVIRQRLNGAYDSARESIRNSEQDSSDAETPYERLGRATRARTSAHEVQVAWRAIEDEVSVDDVRASRSAVETDLDEFTSWWEYVGDDPVRAGVVHAEIEREIRGARNWLSVHERELAAAAEQPLDFADVAVDIERARDSVTVASYLFDRFRSSLDTERNLRERLENARGTFEERIRTRGASLPEEPEDPTSLVDRDIDRTAGVVALSDLLRDARWRLEDRLRESESPSLATAATVTTEALVYFRAFESLRDRIEDGDDIAIETADDVAVLRADAIDGIQTAVDAGREQFIVGTALPGLAREIRWTDEYLSQHDGDVPIDSVSREAAEYVVIEETCRALPPVSATVAAVLRGERDG